MKKYILIACFILTLVISAQAQQQGGTQAFYAELGGAGLAYSFNYDFRFDKDDINSWGMRIGAGGWSRRDRSWGNSSEGLLTMPIMLNKLYGRDTHFFEMGLGTTFIYYRDRWEDWNGAGTTTYKEFDFILPSGNTPAFMGVFNLGYRRVPVDGGFTFRANLTPIFNHNGFWPLWVGVGFGYAF
ncbi:hypothetical protein [Mongoliitalea daihaiensis]|uniref:hypothetical protein n=1 Tax=Mongoliitalea daihaiensis TaxID=2782006 RepID=UPI001F253FA9|nr:hypothetical protein [Mongoliitalea daihaiensis]UJP63403.1 hypothetical protein IPZ59_11135 [Mongoliitalea daihaiensis]